MIFTIHVWGKHPYMGMVDWLVDAWACCRQVMYYWGEGGEAVGLGADVVAPP